MKSKVEVSLTPTRCIDCETSASCYFGRFFYSLKTLNCRVKNNNDDCSSCQISNACVMSKFENIKVPMIFVSKEIPCDKK